jgi:hypothetical protein
VLVAGEANIAFGEELAREALSTPPYDYPINEQIDDHPYATVPEHVLGLAYLKRADYQKAMIFLEEAAAQRPQDGRIRKDLELAQTHRRR